MALEVLTPFNRAKVALATKRFRKQILRPGEFDYTDEDGKSRKLKFDLSYFQTLKKAFDDRAFDSVAFQLTDGKNSHDVGPERTRGVLLELEEPTAEDGLWGLFDVNDDGRKILETNPDLGVSARIFENVTHADRRTFPAALHQVLGTTDPVITGMKPWQAVELSRTGITSTIDLSEQEHRGMPTKDKTGDDDQKVTLELSVAARDRLLEMLDDAEGADELAKLINGDSEGDDEDSEGDDEDSEGEGEGDTPPAPAQDRQARLQLSRANARIAELERLNREKDVDSTLTKFGSAGLAPAIIDLARDLMLEPGQTVIELSRGGKRVKATVGSQVEQLLTTVLELARDGKAIAALDEETGEMLGTSTDHGQLSALVDAWEKEFPA